MNFIRDRVLRGELMFGIGANLGSSLTVEMIGKRDIDWTWIDCEHGKGFTFFVVGSDGGCAANGLQDVYATCNTFQ